MRETPDPLAESRALRRAAYLEIRIADALLAGRAALEIQDPDFPERTIHIDLTVWARVQAQIREQSVL